MIERYLAANFWYTRKIPRRNTQPWPTPMNSPLAISRSDCLPAGWLAVPRFRSFCVQATQREAMAGRSGRRRFSLNLVRCAVICFACWALGVGERLPAREFDITDYGATANDQTDDTTAIEEALAACREAGGGVVRIPAGTFVISRRNNESPILEAPPNTTIRGEGACLNTEIRRLGKRGQLLANDWRSCRGRNTKCRDSRPAFGRLQHTRQIRQRRNPRTQLGPVVLQPRPRH